MATPRKSIKKAIESKRDKLFEKWYDREINIYVIYDRVHNKKYYSTSQKYEWEIQKLFKKYPEVFTGTISTERTSDSTLAWRSEPRYPCSTRSPRDISEKGHWKTFTGSSTRSEQLYQTSYPFLLFSFHNHYIWREDIRYVWHATNVFMQSEKQSRKRLVRISNLLAGLLIENLCLGPRIT